MYKRQDKHQINFIVPSGNFGNIFSAFVAKQMGLPIGHLHIATNSNDILKSIVDTGEMKKKSVSQTYSPSMDIQVSSNFERQIFESLNRDSKRVNEVFESFSSKGFYQFDDSVLAKFQQIYKASSIDDSQTLETIKFVYEKYNYIADPHTATGLKVLLDKKDNEAWVSLVCAHPAKFDKAVNKAINKEIDIPKELSNLFDKEEKMTILPNSTMEVKNFILEKISNA